MENDSDTESEPESSLPLCSAAEFIETHIPKEHSSQESTENGSAQNVVLAVETLKSINLSIVQQVSPEHHCSCISDVMAAAKDTSLHKTIQGACDDILSFLHNIQEADSTADPMGEEDFVALADLCEMFWLHT